ncbi:hypothetical protein [Agromyces sp. NPDC049794]|uniref:hypothetical protein n=1 Tax=Agromyces sp. NPDC049794 TaxID=3154362 RepID=UPI0033F63B18
MTHRVSTMDQHRRRATTRGSVPGSGPAVPVARTGPAALTEPAAPVDALVSRAAPAGASARH